MLHRAEDLNNYTLGALDGDIGKVKDFYFDDQSWAVRYLVADTGDWLSDRRVLISPYALDTALAATGVIPVALTKKQIEDSPSLEAHKPVSRQYEMQYYPYYGWPGYWDGPYMWGVAPYPQRGAGGWSDTSGTKDNADPHLRSTQAVAGYSIHASDGEVGHVQDFIVDDETWAIRYLTIATHNWWPGKNVLIATSWIERISWEESCVFVDLTRETIKHAPEYSEDALITRDYEARLHRLYKREGYWSNELTGASK